MKKAPSMRGLFLLTKGSYSLDHLYLMINVVYYNYVLLGQLCLFRINAGTSKSSPKVII